MIAIVAGSVTMCGDSDEEKAANAEAAKAAHAECQKSLPCIGEKLVISAGYKCPAQIEKLASHSVKWVDGTLEPKFSRYRWSGSQLDVVTLLGDKAQFQNGFGAYTNVIYECDMSIGEEPTVLGVRVQEGRL
ncbi:MAG: zinc ribbon domain-containing protein [Hydrogenophaga sp.]|uniref:zinc ribbon domain-containing protein n=1 Tax=Hydrogenophaga sp. TaxID=1904254 RepID=UPI002720F6F4|nr:zinc ribbon domain-containing protein [Hydrogenophaga sp.]MDO9571163.1 zinc ribbon domain-containing protein [Hydrogenophaga sp.]